MRALAICGISIIILAFAATSCSSRKEMKADLARYAEQMLEITPLESAGIGAYQRRVGKNYTTDARVINALKKNALPKLRQFRAKLDEIHPTTEELIVLHETYKKKTDAYVLAFSILIEALNEQDEAMITEANKHLAQTEVYHKEWEKGIKELRE